MAPGAAAGLAIRLHTDLAGLEVAWRAAETGLAGYAFQSFEWIRSWQETCGRAERVRPAIVVVADDAGRPLVILPLGLAPQRGLRVLLFLGGNVTDYNAPLIDPGFAAGLDDAAAAALWRRILAVLPRHDLRRLVRMPALLDGPDSRAVPNPFARLPGSVPAGVAQSATLPASHAAFQQSLNPRFVTDTRRRWRRLREEGRVSLLVARDEAERRRVHEMLMRMKSRRWRDTGARDWSAVPHFRAFYAAMSDRRPADGEVHASLLRVGEADIAAHWGVVWRGRFYCLLLGWEAGIWIRFSTGRLITDRLVEQAIAEGLYRFDFTVGDETYKQFWVNAELPLFEHVGAVSLPGRAALAAEAGLQALRARAEGTLAARGRAARDPLASPARPCRPGSRSGRRAIQEWSSVRPGRTE